MRDEASDKALWGAIDNIRKEQFEMNARVEVHERQHTEFAEWRKRNEEQMDMLITSINNAALKYAEQQGAAKLGKWIISLLAAMGLGGWVTNHFMAGGPPPPGVGGG